MQVMRNISVYFQIPASSKTCMQSWPITAVRNKTKWETPTLHARWATTAKGASVCSSQKRLCRLTPSSPPSLDVMIGARLCFPETDSLASGRTPSVSVCSLITFCPSLWKMKVMKTFVPNISCTTWCWVLQVPCCSVMCRLIIALCCCLTELAPKCFFKLWNSHCC